MKKKAFNETWITGTDLQLINWYIFVVILANLPLNCFKSSKKAVLMFFRKRQPIWQNMMEQIIFWKPKN